MKTYPVD